MTAPDLVNLLRQQPFCAGMGDADLRFLAGLARLHEYRTGQYLFFEGDPATVLPLLISGAVSLEVAAGNLGLLAIETLGPGEVIGKSAVTEPYRYSLNAKAAEPTVALLLEAEPLRARCASDPAFGYDFLRRTLQVAARRLVGCRQRLLEVMR